MNNFILNGEVVQKVISPETYDILLICKQGNGDLTQKIQDYILEQYLNIDYLTSNQLYNFLLNKIFELLDENQIKNILSFGIDNCFKYKAIKNDLKYSPIDHADLVEMLISTIQLLPFRKTIDNKYVDLFLIDKNGVLMSCDEYAKVNKKSRCKRK